MDIIDEEGYSYVLKQSVNPEPYLERNSSISTFITKLTNKMRVFFT